MRHLKLPISENPFPSLKKDSIALSEKLDQYYWGLRLKSIKRQGWLDHHIPSAKCESVADHSFNTMYLALLLMDYVRPKLNREKIVLMGLIHDLGESQVGDITPNQINAYKTKSKKELRFFHENFRTTELDKELTHLFQEFDAQKTPESQFIKFIDKLEMRFQAGFYHRLYPNEDFSDFFHPLNFYQSFTLLQISDPLKKLLETFHQVDTVK